jgi:2,3-bisphosphoglycerate-independent phosphoglycerate mutase
MISAVDLLKGIGVATNMQVAEVDGATGNYDTNFLGKAKKVVEVLRNGADFVYLHMEAPDECGHHGDAENKIYSIEQISEVVVKYIIEQLEKDGEDFNMLICPDHPTPLNIKTHSADPIPYILFRSKMQRKMPPVRYDEINAKNTGVLVENGYELMLKLLEKI